MTPKMSNVKEIYQEYLRNLRDKKNSSRYVGMESYHHSSRSGLCMRKHYYGSVAQVDGKPVDDKTLRIFRIGDLIHTDIQDAMRWYADSHALPIFIEKELFIEEYNVRGFIDLALVSDDILFDIAKNKGPEKSLIILGYSGWGNGQLEGEMERDMER